MNKLILRVVQQVILFIFLTTGTQSFSQSIIISLKTDKDTICEGECITIAPAITVDIFPYTYKWGNGFEGLYLEDCPDTTTEYCLTVTDGNGNTKTKCLTIVINPAPEKPILSANSICEGDSSLVQATGAGSVLYYVYDSLIGGRLLGTTPLYVAPVSTTSYYVESFNNKGCKNLGERQVVTVHTKKDCQTQNSTTDSFEIYPNPAANEIYFKNIDLNMIEQVNIFDIVGRQIKNIPGYQAQYGVDISDYTFGKYFVQCISTNGMITKPFVIYRTH